jgi:hypothetical protein
MKGAYGREPLLTIASNISLKIKSITSREKFALGSVD